MHYNVIHREVIVFVFSPTLKGALLPRFQRFNHTVFPQNAFPWGLNGLTMGSDSSNKDLDSVADPGIRSGGADRRALPKGTLCELLPVFCLLFFLELVMFIFIHVVYCWCFLLNSYPDIMFSWSLVSGLFWPFTRVITPFITGSGGWFFHPQFREESQKYRQVETKHQAMSPMGLFLAQFKLGASTSFESFVAIWTYHTQTARQEFLSTFELL